MAEYLTQHLHTVAIDVVRLCLWLAILSVIFVPLERLFPLHRSTLFRAEFGNDLAWYFINALLPALVLSVPLAIVAEAAHLLVPPGFHAAVAEAPFWARTLAALVVAETGYYWGHRMMHEVPALWRFHSVHHSATHIDFLVNSRAHPVDIVFSRLCGLIPVYIVGLAGPVGITSSIMPLLITVAGTVWGFFIHANLRWRLGSLEWLVTTPAFHHWHHSLVAPTNRNFASTLPCLDWIFGTFHLPKEQWPARYGIRETMPTSLGEQLLQPLLEPRPWPVGQPGGTVQRAEIR